MTRVWLSIAAAAIAAWALVARQPSLDNLARQALSRIHGEIEVPHLRQPVRVLRDEWGVPHISAASADDLFFAQGYVAAQDRLWQMEVWRRAAEGRLAEVAGSQAVPRDRLARLLKFRGSMDDAELATYHPDARRLMSAFVNGVNAYISQHRERLPVEFVLTGIVPDPWTIETLTLRQTTFGDAANELQLARAVAQLGPKEANRLANPDPPDDLDVPEGLDVGIIGAEVIGAARVGSRAHRFGLLPAYRGLAARRTDQPAAFGEIDPGSNNWVVSGALSTTGKPVVVNDPHREVTLPSLRYIFHLEAPGWNVIGASEPPFLGVAVGHNDRVAWGLTIVGTDQHDVYVEELNPAKPDEVRWNGRWEPMRIVREEITVQGASPVAVELKFTRHGPVFFEDRARHRAYALRSALHQPGTAPYLAGLRLSQTTSCREFLEAAVHWHAPSENLICGDVEGNIAWRASALTPDRNARGRNGWSGRLPVPGTGRFEWQGFRQDLPSALNPSSGLIVTANHNVQPAGYSPPFMFKNADTRFERITRLRQLLVPGRAYSLDDHQRMQLDALSLRAAADLSAFRGWTSSDQEIERARDLLARWDAVYRQDSIEAALYETWRDVVQPAAGGSPQMRNVGASLQAAINRLTESQGPNWSHWRWGRMHARAFQHPLVSAFDLPPVERSGGAGTVAADGATYREILDVSNWDRSLATNTPGQSGQPGSPYYGNLLPLWAGDRYFPLLFSRQAVESRAKHRLTLRPQAK
jgi:penicillin G amidase